MVRDSYLLLNAGLEKLVDSLRSRAARRQNVWREFPHTRRMLEQHYPHVPSRYFRLALRKGVFPYEYFSQLARLDEGQLPGRPQFWSSLNASHISHRAYRHAQRVWRAFRCETLRDYSEFYVATDTALLMDVLTSSRHLLYRHYGLDLAHFVSLPSFAMQAALKITGVKLELVKDPAMLRMIDAGMIGGVSMVDTALFRANTPYLDDEQLNSSHILRRQQRQQARSDPTPSTSSGPTLRGTQRRKRFKPHRPKRDLFSVDANALYSWAMSQTLPVSDFAWLDPEELATFTSTKLDSVVATYQDTDETGYFLKVDLDYPPALHRLHDTFPLAPEHLKVPFEQLTSFQQQYLLANDMKHVTNHEKLIPNLYDKKEYVLHIKNLQQYMALGLVVSRVHSVIRFKQAAWLKPYIDLNTRLRQEGADDPLAVAFFKLMNNIIYARLARGSG